MIRPRSMIFTLYGDYIRPRGGQIWIGSLVKLLAPFGWSDQAVRSAVSRTVQKGWLQIVKAEGKSYYSLTERGEQLLAEGTRRIFERRAALWDGEWRMLTYSIPENQRELRDELRTQLSWLGYGLLSNATWLCPHDLEREVAALVARLGIEERVEIFVGRHRGFLDDRALAARCWNLAEINARYAAFLAKYRPCYDEHGRRLDSGEEVPDVECFVQRVLLIHEYRKFPFSDPQLPRELLPDRWLGDDAAGLFHAYHSLLGGRANRFCDAVFELPGGDAVLEATVA